MKIQNRWYIYYNSYTSDACRFVECSKLSNAADGELVAEVLLLVS